MEDKSATIEYARLLWKEGSFRKAIRTLEGAIAANTFVSQDTGPTTAETFTSSSVDNKQKQNMLTARVSPLRGTICKDIFSLCPGTSPFGQVDG